VVIDVAMTETARRADYVLPGSSQYEKVEATFFGGGFPDHVFQMRQRLFEPMAGTLTEPEMHSRLCRALGAFNDEDLVELRSAAAESREKFALVFAQTMGSRPDLAEVMPVVLYETLGRSLGEGLEGAALIWGACQQLAASNADPVRRAGFEGEGAALGDALFEAILTRREGVVITRDPYEVSYERLATDDGRIQLLIPELIEELIELAAETPPAVDDAFPFILAAGERRGSTANTIYRDPSWRKKDREGALRMSPGDADSLGIDSGDTVRVTTKRGSVETVIEVTDTLRDGHVTLPNGRGVEYPDERGERLVHGVPPNELTSSEDRDWLAGTPWHKHVRAKVEVVA
jgi:formate dehydrogenase